MSAKKEVVVESAFAEVHKNFDDTIGRFTWYLKQGNLAKAKSILNAVAYDSEGKTEAGDVEGGNIAATLAEQLGMIIDEYFRASMIKREKRALMLALEGNVECYPRDGSKGYRGCGGAGLTFADGEQRTCPICEGRGKIERQSEASDLIERASERYGSLALALQALDAELVNNRFVAK